MLENEAVYRLFLEGITSFPTERKIKSFRGLKHGWHYGEGEPIEEEILGDAISLFREATRLAFFETDAFPGLNGEIRVTIYLHDHYLEFTVEPDRSVTFHREMAHQEVCHEEHLSLNAAKARIADFRADRAWNTSDSSTSDIMTTIVADSRPSSSRTPAGQEEDPAFLSLVYSASSMLEGLYASISENTTQGLPTSLPSSGASHPIYYPAATA
ncbi:MAG: hypothetical protein FJY85_18050 [Deltaproteobacteria bacterium]|nr:hypothetical protein [Deltaproteobacteria bacterium]